MDQTQFFLEHFVKTEYEAKLALHTEKSNAILDTKIELLETFYDESVTPEVVKPFTKRDAQFFKDSKDSLQTIRQRRLIQIKKYLHPKLKELYRCYLTINLGTDDSISYYVNFYVALKKKQLKIVSKYLICMECSKFGEDYTAAESCEYCKGTGWEYFTGVEFKNLGTPVELKKINAPDNKKNRYIAKELADYNAK